MEKNQEFGGTPLNFPQTPIPNSTYGCVTPSKECLHDDTPLKDDLKPF